MTFDDELEVEATRQLLRELDLIAAHEPASREITPLDSARLARDARARRPATHRRRRLSVTLVAAAACVAVVVAVVGLRPERTEAATSPRMLTYSLGDPTELAGTSDARTALTAAAELAASQPDAPSTGDIQHVASYGWSMSIEQSGSATVSRVYPTVTSSWLAADGSATITQSRGAALDLDGRVVPDTPTGVGGTDELPAGTFDAALATTLANQDLAELENALLALASPEPCEQDPRWHAQCLVDGIQQLHALNVVPPELGSRLWQVLADEPDVRDLGTTIDRFGRPAWAVALPSDPADPIRSTVTVLLISPETGELAGTEVVTLADTVSEVEGPTVTTFTAWTARARVLGVGES